MALSLLDRLNLGRIWLQTAPKEYLRWQTGVSQGSEVSVYYGFDYLPNSGDKSSGGIVKVQDLQSVFPNILKNANILYLISSCLPPFAVRMARLAQKSGCRVVLNQNGVAYKGWYGPGWQSVNEPMGNLLQMSDYVVYQSRFCKHAADRFLGSREEAFTILHNPVDTSFFVPRGNKEDKKAITLLIAGSHQSYYRVQVAIEALRRVVETFPEAQLVIAGRCCWEKNETLAVNQIVELVKKYGLDNNVQYTGSYTQLEAPFVFQQADILLHTKYNDPCPRLVVEAMACGLPVVYSATGGVPELVGPEAGRGVPGPVDWDKDHPPDPEQLAREVLQLIPNLGLYSDAARKRSMTHLDVKPWLSRHQKIFANLLQ